MPALAEAGYHVIAPDQRGYGRTGWKSDYDGDLNPFRLLNLVRAFVRSEVFRSVALMSPPCVAPWRCAKTRRMRHVSLRTRLAACRLSNRSIGIAMPGLTVGKRYYNLELF